MRWAEQTPPGFRFAPKLAGNRPGLLADFGPRVARTRRPARADPRLADQRPRRGHDRADPRFARSRACRSPSTSRIRRGTGSSLGWPRRARCASTISSTTHRFATSAFATRRTTTRRYGSGPPRLRAGRRAALRVLQARGRTDGAGVRRTPTGAARSVNVALLVGSGDRVLQGVLLPLVRNVRRSCSGCSRAGPGS